MNQTTREFLIELKALMEKYRNKTYEVEFTVLESCHGYQGFSVDGIELTVPTVGFFGDGESYNSADFIEFRGMNINAQDIEEKLKEGES